MTNDNLALLLSALALLASLHLLKVEVERDLWWVAGAGALLALAMYTKMSLLFLLPLGLGCALVRFGAHRSIRKWLLESSILAGAAILPFLLGLLFLPGLREQVVYAYASWNPNPEYLSLGYVGGLWPQTSASFWGRFGWRDIIAPSWIATLMNVITLVGLLATLVLVVQRGKLPQSKYLRRTQVSLWAVLGPVVLGFLCYNLVVRQPQGRLLFTTLPALAILVALGYRRLSGRYNRLVGSGIVLFTFAVNLVCSFGTLLPAYAPPA